ncbi:MAG: hypothetical protein Kow00114_36060 [Kiloniellaceae bacterium]
MPTFITPVDVTPGTLGVFTTVDVSAHVSASATGAILRVANAASVDRAYGLRRDSGDTSGGLYGDLDAEAQNWEAVPLTAAGTFQARLESASLSLELVGYFEAEAGFPSAPQNLSLSAGSYREHDITALTDPDAADLAFLGFYAAPGLSFARIKGAALNAITATDSRQPIACGVDGDGKLQVYTSNFSQRCALLGWLKSGVVAASEPPDVTPGTTGSWQTHALPAGATGAVFWAAGDYTENLTWGARKKGSALAWTAKLNEGAGLAIVEADGSAEVELYAGEGVTIYRIGYFASTDDFTMDFEAIESATEVEAAEFEVADTYTMDFEAIESATEVEAAEFTSIGFDASPPVIALVALPYDTSVEVTLDGPPSPFGSVAFGETAFSSFGAESALYASDAGYDSRATDTPASMPFPPAMLETALFDVRAFDGDRPTGASKEQAGALALANGDGRYDAAALLGWDGRTVELWRGTKNRAFADFNLLLRGTAQRVSFDESRFVIALRDRQAIFDVPVNAALFGGAGGLDGHAGIAGLAKPWIGGRVFNVPLVNNDPVNLVFMASNGRIHAVDAVRDNGIALTFSADYADYDALLAASIALGEYATCLALGLIRLGGAPVGEVTADVQGDASGSGYVETTAGILRRIVTSRLGGRNLSASEVDSVALDALAAAQPAPVGYFAGTQPVTARQALDALAGGIGGWHAFTREGKFTAARLDLTGVAAETVTARETAARQPASRVEVAPVWQIRVAWGRSWLVQSADALADEVDPDAKTYYGQAARYAVAQDSTIRARHRLAVPLTVESFFAEQSDAESEAARLLALYGSDRDLWTLGKAGRLGGRWLGDLMSLDLGRYGQPKTCQVVGVREDYGRNEVSLVLWG